MIYQSNTGNNQYTTWCVTYFVVCLVFIIMITAHKCLCILMIKHDHIFITNVCSCGQISENDSLRLLPKFSSFIALLTLYDAGVIKYQKQFLYYVYTLRHVYRNVIHIFSALERCRSDWVYDVVCGAAM